MSFAVVDSFTRSGVGNIQFDMSTLSPLTMAPVFGWKKHACHPVEGKVCPVPFWKLSTVPTHRSGKAVVL